MRILFIGGTGNISAECAALLHARGHEIIVVSRGRSIVPPEYRTVVADCKDPAALRAALGGQPVDVAINFLGYELADVQADYDLFKDVVRQYIFISSATVYEKPPLRLPITEDAPKGNAWWDYARKKQACEEWLLQRWEDERFPVTIVRPSHTYSKRWIPNPVSSGSYSFAARLERGEPVFVPDSGETQWTLTAASDFAVGLAGLVGNHQALGEAFHITSDEVLTWRGIVEEIAAALGVDSPEIVGIPTDFICQVAPSLTGTLKGDKSHPGVFDNSKIKRFVPEFLCRKPFSAGIRESVEWLRAHPEQQNPNPQVDAMCDGIISAWRIHLAQQPDSSPSR
jgi:nucleoside-diphosphate-sugar epimerase